MHRDKTFMRKRQKTVVSSYKKNLPSPLEKANDSVRDCQSWRRGAPPPPSTHPPPKTRGGALRGQGNLRGEEDDDDEAVSA